MDHWTRFSKTGVHGDPTLATPEKGKVIYEAVVNAFVRLVKEFKDRPQESDLRHDRVYPNQLQLCRPLLPPSDCYIRRFEPITGSINASQESIDETR